MVRAIAAAAEEQSSASAEISDNIMRINAVSREASEAARQAAEAVSQLSQKSESLLQLTERFSV
jgi:methyl-accepting chemotaxis protein